MAIISQLLNELLFWPRFLKILIKKTKEFLNI